MAGPAPVAAALDFTPEDLILQVIALIRLHELAMQPSDPVELQSTLQGVLETTVDLHRASRGVLSLFDSSSEMPRIVASMGFDEAELRSLDPIIAGPSADSSGSPFFSRKRVVIEDAQADSTFEGLQDGARLLGFGAIHSVPILTKSSEAAGIITVFLETARRPTPIEIQLADICARHAAGALEITKNHEALREGEERYRSLIEALPVAVYATDADGRVKLYNQAAVALWGRAPNIGDDRWCGSLRMYSPDGSDLPLDQCPMAISIKEKRPLYAAEAVVERPDGTRRDILAYPQPIFNSTGMMVGAVNTLVDITERKKAERALRQVNVDLQEFAYAAAHDLQEPLRNVAIYSEMLERRLGSSLDGESQQLLGYMTDGARRMQALVTDLLAYTHLGGKEEAPTQVDANHVVHQVIETLQPSIEAADASIEIKELPIVVAHESRLSQVFQNFFSNAIKYRRPDEPLKIAVNAEKQAGQWRFSVSDNGMGIDPAYHQQIFGIFKRLHRSDASGTGIGLAICKRIVEQYGGSIWVESKGENKGATFCFTLPVKG